METDKTLVPCSQCHELIKIRNAHYITFEDAPDSAYVYVCDTCFRELIATEDKKKDRQKPVGRKADTL